MKQNILYIGRFQPFHRGHADAVSQIIEKYPELTQSLSKTHLFIGIGSAEENFTPINPLTAGERFEIIDLAMQELAVSRNNYSIIPVRNINNYALWPHHVQQFFPKINVFVSGSPLVRRLWENSFSEAKIISLSPRVSLSATYVRKSFKDLKKDVKRGEVLKTNKFLLLDSTEKFLIKIDFKTRLQNMNTSI